MSEVSKQDYEQQFTADAYDASRRRFLVGAASTGLAAAGLAGEWNANAHAQGVTGQGAQMPPPIKLEPISAPTERENEQAPNALPPDKRVGVAIVGLGRLTLEQILPAFGEAKRCKPVALVSGDQAKARQVAQQYGIKAQNLYSYQNYDDIKNNPDVDVIYIVLPNSMHAEYTVRGAQAGKHILCEKPMATNVKEAQQMVDACKRANKKLMIAYRIQYEPYNRSVMQMVRGGELGAVKVLEMANGQNQGGDLNQWRLKRALAGGGSLPDVGLYCLNTARFLTGEEPVEISANMYSTPNDPRFTEVEENVNWMMRFPSGIQAVCSTSYGWHENRYYRVLGAEKWAQMSPAFSYNNLRLMVGHKSKENPKFEVLEERQLAPKNQFALEMDHMAECVQDNKQPFTPGEEGLQDHRLMAAIYEAAHNGRTVKMPAISGPDAFRGTPPSMQTMG